MQEYVVRGPNWKFNVTLEETFENVEYEYIEAATRAVEDIYKTADLEIDTLDGSAPKFSAVIQVAKVEHDIEISVHKREKDPKIRDLTSNYLENKLIRFIFTPLILANAGKFEQAEFLKEMIENET